LQHHPEAPEGIAAKTSAANELSRTSASLRFGSCASGSSLRARSAASASRQYSKLETWRTVPAPPALPAWRQPRRRRR
jgi:hypothetical protein